MKVGARFFISETRFNAALACIASLLFAGVVAGTGAILSAILMRHSPVVERPQAARSTEQGAGGSNPRLPAPRSLSPAAPVAHLGREIDCVWSSEASAPKSGGDLAVGRKLVLESGLAEIVFDGGAETVLEGPATLEIRSRASIALDRGKCAVTADKPSARGFTIHAPGMTYTDLGTEFGVLVAPAGQQEVHVFRGRVQAVQGAESKERRGHGLPSPDHAGAPAQRVERRPERGRG